jgi:hypothetical protein
MQNQEANNIEFIAIQNAAEELLLQIARAEVEANTYTLSRLDKLTVAGAKLAYSQGCLELLSDQMHNLIAWCDHLDEPEWKSEFINALATTPLQSPWKVSDCKVC